MRIWILGNFGKEAFENHFVRNFKQLDQEVICTDIEVPISQWLKKRILNKVIHKLTPHLVYQKLNDEVLKQAALLKPDAIIVFKGMTLFPDTIFALRKYGKFVCNYNADHPFVFSGSGSGNSNVTNSIPLYDFHISYSVNIAQELQKNGQQAYTVPFGYDEKIQPAFNIQAQSEFLFIGAWDKTREQQLAQINLPFLKIYGSNEWANKSTNSYIKSVYQNKFILHQEYAEKVASCIGLLNFLRHHNKISNSHNMRTFEVPAYAGLLVSERTTEQQTFFEEDKEMVFFSTLEEARQKVTELYNNPQKVAAIKKAALERSHKSNYSYFHRAKEMIAIFQKHL